MKKKVGILVLALILLSGVGVYFGKIDLSFLGLKSAILSADNCSAALIASNKAEYDKAKAELPILTNYLTANSCEENGHIKVMGKTNIQISGCQRKINLRNNKANFITGYEACQSSITTGPKVMSGGVVNDVGVAYRTLIEQADDEDMHLNESVYALSLRSQGESYLRELNYEMTLPVVDGTPTIVVTKAELTSTKSGTYACSQNPAAPVAAGDTTQKFIISCRSTDGGYRGSLDNESEIFAVNLNLSVSYISATGEGKLKFVSGKFSTTAAGGTETNLATIPSSITEGTLKYTVGYIDTSDLSVELSALSNTSSTTIPVKATFNKLINISSVTTDDFVLSDNASATNLNCANVASTESGIRTICTVDVEPNNIQETADITIDFPAGNAKDRTRPTPKTNSAAAQKVVHYVFGAPQIFVGAPCNTLSASCEGLDNTPQLIIKAAIGDIAAGSKVYIYDNATCAGNSPVQNVTATRDMAQIDLYEKIPLTQGQTKTYSAKIYNNCSALGSSANKTASYKYTGETIAQVDRLACMSTTTFQYPKFAVGPFVENKIPLCETADTVLASKCNAWQDNGTFNPECFPTGQGTLNNPYRICTPEQLQEMDNAPGKHFRLGKSINMTAASTWHGGKGFQPIGRNLSAGFWGSLDGNGFEIQNLTFNNSDSYIGLFGSANGASFPGFWVNNLKLNSTRLNSPGANNGTLAGYAGCAIISGVESNSFNISGAQKGSGGLIGVTYLETKVLFSKAQGSITTNSNMPNSSAGGGWVGGLIGAVPGSMLEVNRCDTNVTINAKGNGIAGMVGFLYGSAANTLKVYNSVAHGKVTAQTGSTGVGGLLGDASFISVRGSSTVPAISGNKIFADSATGDVNLVGGLVGFAKYGEFIGNRSEFPVEGHLGGSIGGFGGRMDNSTASQNSSIGEVGGENSRGPRGIYVGGFAGNINAGTYTNNYTASNVSTSEDGPARWIGGFAGLVGSASLQKNYASGNIELHHQNNHTVGGFVGAIGQNDSVPFTLTDNYSTGTVSDEQGLYQGYSDYVGGFIGTITKRATDTFDNNYFINGYTRSCTGVTYAAIGNGTIADKIPCGNITDVSVLNDSAHAVYTRSGNAWDFTNTWAATPGALPTLK